MYSLEVLRMTSKRDFKSKSQKFLGANSCLYRSYDRKIGSGLFETYAE